VAEHPDHCCFGVWLCNEKVLASAEEAEGAVLGILFLGHVLVLSRFHWQGPGYFWLPLIVGTPELALVIFPLGLTLDADGNLLERNPQ
jgi:hypothetical protein